MSPFLLSSLLAYRSYSFKPEVSTFHYNGAANPDFLFYSVNSKTAEVCRFLIPNLKIFSSFVNGVRCWCIKRAEGFLLLQSSFLYLFPLGLDSYVLAY